jgi:MFS family permease
LKTAAPSHQGAEYPPGLKHAYFFAVFNALSFQMILNSPMVLYAKSLGATATVLGIISGMMPLLVIFQIPAARHVARVGYKRFTFAGWSTRVLFIFGMALVPLTGVFLNAPTRLALVLMLLFGFNLSRGITSCAWLPWITSIVPEGLRGHYLAREAACVNVSSAVAFLLAAFCLGTNPAPWQFSVLFGFSGLMGAVSLNSLNRMPEGETMEETRVSTTRVPWREIAEYPPFRKLLWLNVAWSSAYGGLTAFVVAYLKTEAGMTEQAILLVTATSFLGGWCTLWLLGARLDPWGSKPALKFSLIAWLVIMAIWALVAGGVLNASVTLLVGLQILIGLATSMFTMSNTRLAMLTIPVMGRNHFFALFSVVGSLTMGISPILWGMMIDALRLVHVRWLGLEWNRYSIFFCAVELVFICAIVICFRLEEPAARKLEDLLRDIFRAPLRLGKRLMGQD